VSRYSSTGLVDQVDVTTRFARAGFQHSQTATETGAHLLGHYSVAVAETPHNEQ